MKILGLDESTCSGLKPALELIVGPDRDNLAGGASRCDSVWPSSKLRRSDRNILNLSLLRSF